MNSLDFMGIPVGENQLITETDVYSSLASLKEVIGVEKNISVMINGYLKKELERLDYLKKLAQEIKQHNDKAIQDGEEAIKHPVNAFLLIKGMVEDWNKVVKIMRFNLADDIIRNMTRQRNINYPTEEDLSGAVTGLLRLQDTYQLDTKDIADGKILNSQIQAVAMTAEDCFEIGRTAYHTEDYYHAIMWMQEARERVEKETVPTANLEVILEHLAFSLYKQGNLKRALLVTDELYRSKVLTKLDEKTNKKLQTFFITVDPERDSTEKLKEFHEIFHSAYNTDPNNIRAKDNIRKYENLLKSKGVQHIDMRRDIPPINNSRNEGYMDEGIMLLYEALCRQQVNINIKVQSQLYCYYKMDRPYLRLAPFKVEIVRQNPLAALFYDIMSDEEARIIQMIALPKLYRPLVRNRFTGKFEPAYYRVTKTAVLKPTEHEIIKRFDKRLELATNLEVETSNGLAVILPDSKISNRDQRMKGQCLEKSGDRIATILIYMTEPEIGGETIFMSNLKMSLPCIKNAALFWYNLMRSGEIDIRSRHAACPVLTGIKWVANKWFRERGQEWRRPCGLNEFDQERYIINLEQFHQFLNNGRQVYPIQCTDTQKSLQR
ncbi:Prolyl 4-hydroxylase subunit [Dirofilaria immitis]